MNGRTEKSARFPSIGHAGFISKIDCPLFKPILAEKADLAQLCL
jgi:hypothetical protein